METLTLHQKWILLKFNHKERSKGRLKMIDLIKAKNTFKEYIQNYNIDNPHIAKKVAHTYRTVNVAETIAKELQLDEENIKLASLIALLHDIGRFEQLTNYHTYSDIASIDHGDLGVKILFEDKWIEKFIEDRSYDQIIYLAIKNHNKYKIQEGIKDNELLHCKIVRDADKTDIFAVLIGDIKVGESKEGKGILYDYKSIGKQKISKEIRKAYQENKQIDSSYIKTEIDEYINMISFIYDYNFPIGLKIVKENQYIEKMIQAVNIHEQQKKQFNEILKIANEYIDRRITKRDAPF